MKDTLCLHKHFSPLSSSNEFEIQNIIDVYHFLKSFITRHSTHTRRLLFILCWESHIITVNIHLFVGIWSLYPSLLCCVKGFIQERQSCVYNPPHNSCIVHLYCVGNLLTEPSAVHGTVAWQIGYSSCRSAAWNLLWLVKRHIWFGRMGHWIIPLKSSCGRGKSSHFFSCV